MCIKGIEYSQTLSQIYEYIQTSLFQDFVRASTDEQLWQDLLISVESFHKRHGKLLKEKTLMKKMKENVEQAYLGTAT